MRVPESTSRPVASGGRAGMNAHFLTLGCFTPCAFAPPSLSASNLPLTRARKAATVWRAYLECGKRNTKFTPLVFSATGGAGPAATAFLKRLADKYAWQKSSSYAQTLNWIRCRPSFALLRSGILCLQGARTLRPANSASGLRQPDLAVVEARLE